MIPKPTGQAGAFSRTKLQPICKRPFRTASLIDWSVRTEDVQREAEKKTVRAFTAAGRLTCGPRLKNPEIR